MIEPSPSSFPPDYDPALVNVARIRQLALEALGQADRFEQDPTLGVPPTTIELYRMIGILCGCLLGWSGMPPEDEPSEDEPPP